MAFANIIGAGIGIGFIENGIVRIAAGRAIRKVAKTSLVDEYEKSSTKLMGTQKICNGITGIAVGVAITAYNVTQIIDDL